MNRIGGVIPSELGQLAELRYLYLSNNQLTGIIPTEFAQLTKLYYLLLSDNYLTGNSPASELADVLQNLSGLEITNNCLKPTDLTIKSILYRNERNWRSKQTSCFPNAASCQLYAVHDEGRNDSQFFTMALDNLSIRKLGDMYEGYDIEALAVHPQTNILYAAAGHGATTGQAGYLYQLNAKTGELTVIGDTQFAGIEDLAFSPNGILYAWAKRQGLITIDLSTGRGTLVLASKLAIEGLTLDKQADNTIFYGTTNGELWQYNLERDTLEVLCTGLQGEIEALEMLNPDELLIGSHESAFGMYFLNPYTCELLLADDKLSNQFNDVEGLAIPVAACPQ